MGWPGATSSSPVETIATVGRRWTGTSARPTAASMPISREVRTAPARRTVSPRPMSPPAAASAAPGATGRRSSIQRPPSGEGAVGSVCSIIVTASAPRGSMPPVAISVAVPDGTGRTGTTPGVTISSLRRRRHGLASEARAVSSACRAKPSTLARSKPGTSTAATTSSASTRPSASPRTTRSRSRGRTSTWACSRACASSTSITSRNCCWRAARASTSRNLSLFAMAVAEEVNLDLGAGRVTLQGGRNDDEPERPRGHGQGRRVGRCQRHHLRRHAARPARPRSSRCARRSWRRDGTSSVRAAISCQARRCGAPQARRPARRPPGRRAVRRAAGPRARRRSGRSRSNLRVQSRVRAAAFDRWRRAPVPRRRPRHSHCVPQSARDRPCRPLQSTHRPW